MTHSGNGIASVWRPPDPIRLPDFVIGFPLSPSDVVMGRGFALDLRRDLRVARRRGAEMIVNGGEITLYGGAMLRGCKFRGDSIVSFHQNAASDKSVLMVAYNSQFDTAFLDHFFRSANRSWRDLYHYSVLDIPSMAWGLGIRDLAGEQLMQYYNIADEPHVAELHTGITGAMKNVRLYRALLRYRQELFEKH